MHPFAWRDAPAARALEKRPEMRQSRLLQRESLRAGRRSCFWSCSQYHRAYDGIQPASISQFPGAEIYRPTDDAGSIGIAPFCGQSRLEGRDGIDTVLLDVSRCRRPSAHVSEQLIERPGSAQLKLW